jgi:hypothetical protein
VETRVAHRFRRRDLRDIPFDQDTSSPHPLDLSSYRLCLCPSRRAEMMQHNVRAVSSACYSFGVVSDQRLGCSCNGSGPFSVMQHRDGSVNRWSAPACGA